MQMATIRRKKAEPFSILQRDPGPWPTLLINWMATLGIIVIFGLVMLFSASYTTGYLRFGDSLHFIRSQVLCLGLGVVAMALFSYIDYRFLRKAGVSALSGTAGAGAVQHAAQRLPPLDLVRRLYGAGIGDRQV